MTPTAVYSGQVVNNDGKPVPGARVRLMLPGDERSHDHNPTLCFCETVCDGQGRFKFESALTNIIVWPIATASRRELFPHYQIGKEFVPKYEGSIAKTIASRESLWAKTRSRAKSVARQYDSAVDHLADLVRDARRARAQMCSWGSWAIRAMSSKTRGEKRLVDREETPIAGMGIFRCGSPQVS